MFWAYLALSYFLAPFPAFAQIICVFPKFFSSFYTLSPDDLLHSHLTVISLQKTATSLSLASSFLRESSLISIQCPTGSTATLNVWNETCHHPPKCLSFPRFSNHTSSNILFLLSRNSNLKVVFDYFLCVLFLLYMNSHSSL